MKLNHDIVKAAIETEYITREIMNLQLSLAIKP